MITPDDLVKSDTLAELIKAHVYNQTTWFCWCGEQFGLTEWADHVAALVRDWAAKHGQ